MTVLDATPAHLASMPPMGEKGRAFFEEANRLGGLIAKIRLASRARVTSSEATTGDDTPQMLERLERAMGAVRTEFGSDGASGKDGKVGRVVSPTSGSDAERVLRRYMQTYGDLMAQRGLFLVDVESTVRRIDEAASSALDVERVSVWFLDEGRTKISCADLYERGSKKHSAGTELFAKDFSPYFEALSTQRTIAAHDAHTDPRTSCFSKVYLQPLGINSMLDVPIWLGPKMVGVICHEHVGPMRNWNSDEESFAYLMSSFVALALERTGKR